MSKQSKVPSYRHQKSRGLAVVRIDGKDYYLGPWQSEESKLKYDALIKQWLANGRTLAEPSRDRLMKTISVAEVIEAFWRFAQERCQKAGSWRVLLRTINDMYGDKPAADFGPVKLRAVVQALVERGNCRPYVNKNMHRTRKIFAWAASHELIEPSVPDGLRYVEALAKGHTTAPEGKKILPVPQDVLEATQAELRPLVRDMTQIQLLLGCRPGELTEMRPTDVDRRGDVWLYTPESHKCYHMGKDRVIVVGPRARMILQRYMVRPADERCFPINRQSYAQAVVRAAKRAGVERWTPAQLRHNRATEIRREFGIEAARCVLGHTDAGTTVLYAERDRLLAVEVARKSG